jgi:hypothetical protein
MSEKLQDVLWCIHQIIAMRRIKKPRLPEGIIVAELDAIIELHYLLGLNREPR